MPNTQLIFLSIRSDKSHKRLAKHPFDFVLNAGYTIYSLLYMMHMTVMNEKYSVRGTHFRLLFVFVFFFGGGAVSAVWLLHRPIFDFVQFFAIVFTTCILGGSVYQNNLAIRPDCLIVKRLSL